MFCSELSEASDSDSESVSPKPVAAISIKYTINVEVNSDKSKSDDQPNKPTVKRNFNDDDINNNMFSILNTIDPVDNRMY